jgi:hypothetical protein
MIVAKLKVFLMKNQGNGVGSEFRIFPPYDNIPIRFEISRTDEELPPLVAEYRYYESGNGNHIRLAINIRNDFSVRDIRPNHAYIKGTIRHELEHAHQPWELLRSGPNMNDENRQDHFRVIEYILSPPELPAYVAGIWTRARIKKTTFENELLEWLDDLLLFQRRVGTTEIGLSIIRAALRPRLLAFWREKYGVGRGN